MPDDQRRPFLKFFPSDWRADPKLRNCSYGARGLWVEMLCLMHHSEQYGFLLINGQAPNDLQIAAQTGGPVEECCRLIAELAANDVFSRDRRGVIYSRKMVRDEIKRSKLARQGKKGGNPILLKKLKEKQTLKPEDKSKDFPRGQRPDSVSKDTDADGVTVAVKNEADFDPVKALFDAGVQLLTAAGMGDKQARGLVGKWRRDAGDDDVIRLGIAECQAARISDPAAYMPKIIANAKTRKPAFQRRLLPDEQDASYLDAKIAERKRRLAAGGRG